MKTLDWTQVEARIQQGEDERTELKTWAAFPKKVAEAVCALGNTEGGLLVLGVDDEGLPIGVEAHPEEVQERLTNLLQSGLNTPVRARLGCHRLGDVWIHWIEVARYRGPEPLRSGGRFLARRGRSSVEPSGAELQELFNVFGLVMTEEQIVPGTSPDDVQLGAFHEFLQRLGLDIENEPQLDPLSDLRNRGVVSEEGGEPRLTLYGLLCFGRHPQSVAAGRSAWVEMVAYSGTDRASEVILHGEAKGRLDEQIDRMLGWFRALGNQESYEGPDRTDRFMVPLRALREAVVNAVVHRDYAILGSKVLLEIFEDRVVITSPGTLPNHMTIRSALAGGHPRTRNELMANFMMVQRKMEMRGRGLPIIVRAMQEFNGTTPEMTEDRGGRFVRLTLFR